MKANIKKNFINVNVILTFDHPGGKHEEMQEFLDIKLPISKKEEDKNAVLFFHNKLFKRIKNKIISLDRIEGELIKISTCSNWSEYVNVTHSMSLPDLGHPCKWYFGEYRDDLDEWEKKIMKDFGFGTTASKEAFGIWEQSIFQNSK